MKDLKPCPFCGSTNVEVRPDEADEVMFVVYCRHSACHIYVGFFDDEEQAVIAWNKRPNATD